MSKIQPLKPELQRIANEELNEIPQRIPNYLQKLKQWITDQSHLKARTDDQFLVQFLRHSHYNLEEAKRRIEVFLTYKTKFPSEVQFVSNRFREIYNLGCVTPLPIPLNDCGSRIVFYRYLYSPKIYRIEEILVVCNALNESLILSDPYACICGIIFVFDMSSASMAHIRHYTPAVVRRLVEFYEKSLPLTIRKICFVNVPLGAEHLFKLLSLFLGEELRRRLFICGQNMTKLTEQIPQKYLPEDYGGSNGNLDQLVKDNNKIWNVNHKYFEEDYMYGIIQNRHPRKANDIGGLLKNS
uniref:CRAL-TRIO domain-containing protein n=1 Tax=Stomoxys calcitrans TaxID=35570 RepID=A0A1I8Q6S8_STOCA